MTPNKISSLADAVSAMHECECRHSGTASVHEMQGPQTLWKGEVEIFDLAGHPEARRAFAWAWQDETGQVHNVAVLEVPPVTSPRHAVLAEIASKQLNQP